MFISCNEIIVTLKNNPANLVDSISKIYALFKTCRQVSTDTRAIEKGDLFFALNGPNFNGNKYADEAMKKGAVAAVVDEPEFKKGEKYFLVENSLAALQQLANHHRKELNIPVIAVAGSNGKTTTKELIKAVLQTTFRTFATEGNLNNEIGVPLSLLRLKDTTQMAVIEMGARQRGDIKFLCDIAGPTHGIITNTGKDHLETFKTVENTRKTNAELYAHLARVDGTAFVNVADNDLLREAAIVKNKITYGKLEIADYFGKIESFYPLLSISYKGPNLAGSKNLPGFLTINSRLTGKYNFENIMAAVAIGKHFKVTDENIRKAIECYHPINNRSQLLKKGSNTFILDAYNANPSSMKEALENLAGIKAENKIAIVGDMLELGDASFEEHFAMAKYIQTLHLQKVVLVGEEFGKVSGKIDCVHFKTTEAAKEWFGKQHFENTTVLLKGSRKLGLEMILS